MPRKCQQDIGKGLIGLLKDGISHQILPRQFCSLRFFSFKQKSSDFRKVFCTPCNGVIMRLPRPESVFVDLYAFLLDAAEDHGAQSSISNWQCLVPIAGWLAIPQGVQALPGFISFSPEFRRMF